MNDLTRILYVIGSLDIGGTEKQLYLLLKYLDRKRFHVTVLSLSHGGYWMDRIRELSIDTIALKRKRSLEIGRLRTLARTIESLRPDIVHSFQPTGNIYAGLTFRRGRNVKLITSRRSFDSPVFDMRKSLEKWAFRRSDAVVCNSGALAQEMRTRIAPHTEAFMIPNSIEDSPALSQIERLALRESLGISADSPVALAVGRLVPIKNHRLFLDIAAAIVTQHPEARFVLVGDGPLREELQTYARQLNLNGKVIITGERHDVPAILHAADVFILTTGSNGKVGEGFPNAVMEAMLAGRPCVVSNSGGTAELFDDAEAGYMVAPEDRQTYVKRVIKLFNEPSLRKAMGLQGRKLILESYTPQACAGSYEKMYSYVRSSISVGAHFPTKCDNQRIETP